MQVSCSVWRRQARILGGLAAPVLLSIAPHALAAPPAPLPTPVMAAPVAPQVFDLREARQAAVERQPSVAAARASLAAAQSKASALEHMGLAALVARDLPIRRKQAALGITIAQAEVETAEFDARHAATFTYLAALYALDQRRTADSIIARLADLKTLAKTALENGRKDVSREQLDLIDSYQEMVEGRREEAIQGYQRALAALREAIGLGTECPIAIAAKELPDVKTLADHDTIVQLALSRRGDVVEATTAVDVFCLEVDAQGRILLSPARTFASGGDIHSKILSAAEHDPDYRPGPVGPEMPVSLTGSRRERQDQAAAYHARAGAVADKARNLVGLEAEDAFLRWKQYQEEQPKLEEAAAKLETFANDLSLKFDPEKVGYPALDDLVNSGLKATQLRLDAAQIKFRRLAALANLERITAGGFDSGLDAPAAPEKKKP
jgi:outer membrane protein TolC